jgi:hypothetical protein
MPTASPCFSKKQLNGDLCLESCSEHNQPPPLGALSFEFVDKCAKSLKFGAGRHPTDDLPYIRCQVRRSGAFIGHIVELRHQRIRATDQCLQDRNLCEAIHALDNSGHGRD